MDSTSLIAGMIIGCLITFFGFALCIKGGRSEQTAAWHMRAVTVPIKTRRTIH